MICREGALGNPSGILDIEGHWPSPHGGGALGSSQADCMSFLEKPPEHCGLPAPAAVMKATCKSHNCRGSLFIALNPSPKTFSISSKEMGIVPVLKRLGTFNLVVAQ